MRGQTRPVVTASGRSRFTMKSCITPAVKNTGQMMMTLYVIAKTDWYRSPTAKSRINASPRLRVHGKLRADVPERVESRGTNDQGQRTERILHAQVDEPIVEEEL